MSLLAAEEPALADPVPDVAEDPLADAPEPEFSDADADPVDGLTDGVVEGVVEPEADLVVLLSGLVDSTSLFD